MSYLHEVEGHDHAGEDAGPEGAATLVLLLVSTATQQANTGVEERQ